jgi:hypothetical protein
VPRLLRDAPLRNRRVWWTESPDGEAHLDRGERQLDRVRWILLATTALHAAEIRDVQITAASSGASYGIRPIESSVGGLRLTSSTINAEDYGIENSTGGPIFIENSQVRATANNGSGVEALYASVTVDHSEIVGATSTIKGFGVFIGATRSHGGAVSAATATCAMVYDESFAPIVGPVCP